MFCNKKIIIIRILFINKLILLEIKSIKVGYIVIRYFL